VKKTEEACAQRIALNLNEKKINFEQAKRHQRDREAKVTAPIPRGKGRKEILDGGKKAHISPKEGGGGGSVSTSPIKWGGY